MYLECTVRIEEDALKEHLLDMGLDEEQINEMDESELQNECTEAVQGILSDYFSDYYVIDSGSIVIGDL